MIIKTEDLLKRIASIEELGNETLATEVPNSQYVTFNSALFHRYRSLTLSFLDGIFGSNHTYFIEFNRKTHRSGYNELMSGIEILKAAKQEIEMGWLQTSKEIISAEIFNDFLEMASHLLENKYKDPAAVMIGSVLEKRLRDLSLINGIEITRSNNGRSSFKKADLLNSELKAKEVYTLLDHKNITAWLELRNKAAHGNYNEYSINQVQHMFGGVSDFISRNKITISQ